MKLGVGYIAFSGLELLKPSIQNIRPFAHWVAVVWSAKSSTGDPIAAYAKPLLDDLVETGLVDELIEVPTSVTTNPSVMQDNCRSKRNTCRLACQKAGCSHFLIRDCDEFHDPEQLANQWVEFEKYDATVSQIREYVRDPMTRLESLSGLYVPVTQRIDLPLARNNIYGRQIDGGRTAAGVKTFKIFSPDELVLHHYTFVRYDEEEMKRKYQGHGHCHRIGSLEAFLTWTKRFKALELEWCEDVFGILQYWRREFGPRWISKSSDFQCNPL
jgi:hypothetical protein